jgi:cell division protein FtsI/penicillin-binding protein 2
MPRLRLPGSIAAIAIVCWCSGLSAGAQKMSPELQSAVTRAMTGIRGTAVVLAVDSGRILAAYNLKAAAQRLASPGSSIKPFTLKALLNAGKVDAATALICKRPLSIAGHRLDCSHPQTGQPLDAATALAYSCNSYFTSMATRLIPSQLRESLIKDGFAQATGIAPGEAIGSIALAPTSDDLQLQAIGEWGVRVTALELLRAYRSLALLAPGKADPRLAPIFQGLDGSTTYGMARSAQPENGVRVAGKTGTATADEGHWTHGWFAGFAPADKPTVVLVVFLEKGRGSDAAEVARQIFASLADNSNAAQAGMGSTQ